MIGAKKVANVYSAFLDLDINLGELADAVSSRLCTRYALEQISVKCTYPVFKGHASGHPPIFVKIGSHGEWLRTSRLLSEMGDCPLFARLLIEEPLDFHGHAVFVAEWKDVETVLPEDMNERQVSNFVLGCETLSRALQAVTSTADGDDESLFPGRLYDVVSGYAKRHPVAGRLLAGLLAIPEGERTFGDEARSVVHGDFHAKNYGFDGDAFSAVFDLGQVSRGLACWDLANALVERYSCLSLSAAARRRLNLVTRRVLSLMPWRKEDFVRAVNVLRLRYAAKRIGKHPNAAWVAVDVWRRDRRMQTIFECVMGE